MTKMSFLFFFEGGTKFTHAHLLPVVFGPNIGVWRSYKIKYKSVQCVSQSVHLVYPLYMNKFGNETVK